ncbi:MAG: POTRA domain-containing protein [Verrucomicrobiota bacterium]
MTQADLKIPGKSCFGRIVGGLTILLLSLLNGWELSAAEPVAGQVTSVTAYLDGVETNTASGYYVQRYVIQSKTPLATNNVASFFSKYTGTNVSLQQIVHAAADLDWEYAQQGYENMTVLIAPRHIEQGVVTLDVFPGAMAQILVAGNRYLISSNILEAAAPPAGAPGLPPKTSAAAAGAAKKTVQGYPVKKYLVMGNTLLPPATIATTLTNASGAFGTNVSFDGIRSAVTGLQETYRAHGYVTVYVGVPPQKLTNDTVRLQVTEGRLVAIEVKGNHYFSSNNVMRALPSLHTNIILNSLIFQAELNRANANQDRRIYPILEPGPDPGTSDLTLKVKDQLPLHAKVEYNDQSSPGTPLLRVNTSAVYDNLWNLEHSLGVQYSFSPDFYKDGPQWNFYDKPLVANYSALYRMPLGDPASIADVIAEKPGSFGYSEATRKFNLPPPAGQPELSFFASRSTIDTGVQNLDNSVLFNIPQVEEISQTTFQQDLTVNNDLGARFSTPLPASGDILSDIVGGLDLKTYQTTSTKTNIFDFVQYTVNAAGLPNPPIHSTVISPTPLTYHEVNYLPLSFNYHGNWRASANNFDWGLGISANPWYSGSLNNLQSVTGSTKSTGHWVILTPRFSWQFPIYTNWLTTLRADGQWASEPLISNEQFGAGGVNSVRGYREGEVFGDTGWHVTLEQETPPHTVGMVNGDIPIIVRGSVYMDYADTYLLDPQGRPNGVALWGTGFGFVTSIGSHWETRFLFSVPLLSTTTTEAYQPFFNFSLTAQF